jgi:serine/threonine protein kinase
VPQATSTLGDRYELGAVLGHGGMARVQRAKDRKLKRSVAVKILASPYDRDKAFVERFQREAHAAASLNHPNIVAVYDSGSENGTHYIVTELVDGETLGELMAREGALPPERAAEIGREVARALAAAHERGVVHRDVKPGNVMITPDGRVKVVDFGIARAAGAESVTKSGIVLGSAPYISPEQARGEPGNERSDIYALGCVLYHMLTGQAPFVADTPLATLYLHVHEPVVPPSEIRPVPAELEAVVMRCMEKDPADRYSSAAEVEGALATDSSATMELPPAFNEATAPVQRVEPSRVSRRVRPPARRWWWIAGVAALVLIVGWIAFILSNPDGIRRAARQAARDTPTQTESPTASPEVVEPTVEEAYLTLVGTIQAAEVSGEIDEGAAEDLQKRAEEAFNAYRDGNAEEVDKKLEVFVDKFDEATEEGKIPFEAAARIEGAFDVFVLAIQTDPPVVVDEGGGDEDDEGGPPSHANSGGNGKGNGNDD